MESLPNQGQNRRDVNLRELVEALGTTPPQSPDSRPLLSPDLIDLIERGLHTHDPLYPSSLRPRAAEAFHTTFELMGGLPRMLLWADRNPTKFYQMYARQTLPTIAPVLPLSQQSARPADWPEWLTQRRLAYQEAATAVVPQAEAQDDPE